jgi:hypothetical protein
MLIHKETERTIILQGYARTHRDCALSIEGFPQVLFPGQVMFEVGERVELLRETVSGIMLALMLIGMLTLAFNVQPVKGTMPPPDSMWIDPGSVSYNLHNATVGKRFNVTAWVNLDNTSFTWAVDMLFNTSLLRATRAGVTAGTTSQFFAGHATSVAGPMISNTMGFVLIGETLFDDDYRTGGSGSLAWFEFEIIAAPNSTVTSLTDTLDITNTDDNYVLLWKDGYTTIPTTNYGATYSFRYVAGIHDVAVNNVISSKTVVSQGFSDSIYVTVANRGDCTETFNVTAYANTTAIGTITVNNMLKGTFVVLTFTWNTAGFAKGNYTVSACAWPVPDETHTADNNFTDGIVTVAIAGDINADGGVDMKDIAVVAKAFGSHGPNYTWYNATSGQTVIIPDASPRWNPDADITGPLYVVPDNKVDIRDVATVAKNLGKKVP